MTGYQVETAHMSNQILDSHLPVEARVSRNFRADILERIGDGFVAFDAQLNYLYVNQRGGILLGRKPEDLIGKHYWQEFPEAAGTPFAEACVRALETQTPVSIENYYAPWDRWFENRVYPSPDGLAIFFREITEQKRAEEALRASEARLRLTTEGSNTGLWDWDIRTNEVYFSPIWKRQIGYEDHEIPNRFEEWENRVHPDDLGRALATVQAYIAAPWPNFENEFRFRHKDGSYRWILARASLLTDEQGQPVRMLGSHLDITERKHAEEELIASRERLRALSAHLQCVREEEGTRIARELHDELGGTLTSLRWDLETIDTSLARSDRETTRAGLHEKIATMTQVIDETINTVRRISSELRPSILDDLGLLAALGWQARQFQTRTGLPCQFTSDLDELDLGREQATAIFRIFQEILTNVLRHAHASHIDVCAKIAGDEFILAVQDDGQGFDLREKLRPGALGLVGMRERAHLIGGSIEITSATGQGTKVAVRLPLPNFGF